jgi:catechol 2,3-dioxygenase-like lactoylglutathione lyase family enzyme
MKSQTIGGLKLPRLGQVGIVVKDIDKTIEYYQGTLGIGPWAVFKGEPAWCRESCGEVTTSGKIAMAQVGPVQIELIQILEGRSVYADLLGEGEGLHHLGFFVRDIDKRLQAAKDAGIEVIQHGLLKQMGLTIEYAYLDTLATGGVIMEFIQAGFMGLPFPMRWSPLLRMGAWLGSKLG